jgi:hypothetical protein
LKPWPVHLDEGVSTLFQALFSSILRKTMKTYTAVHGSVNATKNEEQAQAVSGFVFLQGVTTNA